MNTDAANHGGGAGTNGPPTKPTKRTAVRAVATAPEPPMTAQEVAVAAGRHHETVLLALRRGLLVGTQSGPKGTWAIERADFNDWKRRGRPSQRAA